MFENLVYWLKPKYRHLWTDYCRYLDLGWQRFCSDKLNKAVKIEQLRLLEKAIRRDFPLKNTLLAQLQQSFVKENLSLYLLLEPLAAWQYLIAQIPDSEAAVSEIIQKIASPAARMMMVLNDENPSTYLPVTSLLSAEFLYCMSEQKSPFVKMIKSAKKRWGKKLNGLWKNALPVLSIVKSKRLKFYLAVELNTFKILLIKMQNNKQPEIDFLDRVRILVYSSFQFLTVRKRTISQKEYI